MTAATAIPTLDRTAKPAIAPERRSAPRLDRLLRGSSRTFAVAIPLLPQPTRREVGLAYLLLRVFDTLEDAALWSPRRRVAALEGLRQLIEDPEAPALRRWAREVTRDPPCRDAVILDLLRRAPELVDRLDTLGEGAGRIVREHVTRTAAEMVRFQAGIAGGRSLRLDSLPQLRAYCYGVAGIVGEMLTELFLRRLAPRLPLAPRLRQRAAAFGEGLQLVNVLKDSAADEREGRRFIGARVPRSRVFRLARRDLALGADYVRALERSAAPRGLVLFTALPLLLAHGTLDRVERDGPGAKLSRDEVAAILARLRRAVERGKPAVPIAAARSPRRRQARRPPRDR